MKRMTGLKILSVRGVDVRLHISLLFLIIYVMLIATVQFGLVVTASGVSPEAISGSPLTWSLIFAVALLVSVLVHELGHVFVAQARGAKVQGVTLMMLGGVSEIEEIPKDPSSEFKIAIIGPIVSFVIGFGLLMFRDLGDSANWYLFAYWIGRLNIALAIFNMLPAYPMDGGRVLRALMSQRYGHAKGTEKAVKVSRVFAWIFGILGLLQFNLILMIIAFVIYYSAKSELFFIKGQLVLARDRARDLMVQVPILSENLRVAEAAQIMYESNCTVLPVEGHPPAILSSSSFARIPQQLWPTTGIEKLKFKIEKPLNAEDSLREVLQAEGFLNQGGYPVLEEGRIVGLLRLRDVLDHVQLGELVQAQTPARTQTSFIPRPNH